MADIKNITSLKPTHIELVGDIGHSVFCGQIVHIQNG